ncbi:phosphotransferase family protein [Streptomyces sp. NBC_01618]|uniref:phosphotransferase family protein n=1 Tax=Streptomyces sp. NBC_01618 TaxID=2975900 RepID=UPI0038684A00|nr:aminoglycoside phosphotransferase family protein [Streptomyces sp. NBC_01618]
MTSIVSFGAIWPTLDDGERRKAIAQLADVLRALHAWQPPERVRSLLLGHLRAQPTAPEAIVGADLCPLPVERAQALVAHAESPGLDLVESRLGELAGLDPYREEPRSIVHGDLHFANLLWDKGRITAVLDFEWVRIGPPDLDLLPLLRSVDWAGSGDAELVPSREMTRIFGRLAVRLPAALRPSRSDPSPVALPARPHRPRAVHMAPGRAGRGSGRSPSEQPAPVRPGHRPPARPVPPVP